VSIDTDYGVLRYVLDQEPAGWAIEFGVYTGFSLNLIADRMPVIGLDSFDGLPEDWRPGFPKGRFGGDRKVLSRLPFFKPNAMLISGLFEDTLPMLAERGLPDFGLVHIDCDLYSSTVTALEGVRPYISEGTWVVFDEYHGYPGYEDHEMKAWREFVDRWRLSYEEVVSGPEEMAVWITGIGVPL
jgi:hypothetical protein